jgi:hypothetical protein
MLTMLCLVLIALRALVHGYHSVPVRQSLDPLLLFLGRLCPPYVILVGVVVIAYLPNFILCVVLVSVLIEWACLLPDVVPSSGLVCVPIVNAFVLVCCAPLCSMYYDLLDILIG